VDPMTHREPNQPNRFLDATEALMSPGRDARRDHRVRGVVGRVRSRRRDRPVAHMSARSEAENYSAKGVTEKRVREIVRQEITAAALRVPQADRICNCPIHKGIA
jgi:hypothetical protein